MSADSKIQWTDATWSPIRARVKDNAPQIAMLHGWKDLAEICEKMKGHVGPHCEFVSSGCNHCYSCTNNHRCLPSNGTGLPFDKRSRELVDIFLDEKILMQPLKWRSPKKVFVENQSDLFGEWVPNELIARVFNVMADCPRHTFQVLTKKAAAMKQLLAGPKHHQLWTPKMWHREVLPNVWLGVSCEDQKTADERIPLLLQTPAAVRFVSYEPALGPVNFDSYPGPLRCNGCGYTKKDNAEQADHRLCKNPTATLDWLIVGGESGPGARPFNIQWARSILGQCKAAGVACFIKQLGARVTFDGTFDDFIEREGDWCRDWRVEDQHDKPASQRMRIILPPKKGKADSMSEWPEDLRIRQWPETDRDNRN